MERRLAIPKISAFLPSSRGILFTPLRWLFLPLYAICRRSCLPARENHWLPLNRIAPANPSVHTISQVIDLFKSRHQCDFGGGCASLTRCTGKNDIFVFWDTQVFESFSK